MQLRNLLRQNNTLESCIGINALTLGKMPIIIGRRFDLNWYSSCAKLMKTSVTQFESYVPKGARCAPSAAAGIYNLVGAAKINNDLFWVVFILCSAPQI